MLLTGLLVGHVPVAASFPLVIFSPYCTYLFMFIGEFFLERITETSTYKLCCHSD